jgi:mannose-1-phosphate guanylyltransferase
VPDTREYGVVIHDEDGRVQGFQEKPEPAEALSDLGNCGIYCFEPEVFDYFPVSDPVDWAEDVFPALLEHDVPFHVHEVAEYWNDVGSLEELRQGTFDLLEGRVGLPIPGRQLDEGLIVGEGTKLEGLALVEPPVWIGENCEIGREARLMGPVVIGDNSRVGEGVAVREAIVYPGADLPPGEILIGAILARAGIVESLRPREEG